MTSENESNESGNYQVVALKYRPQAFADLIGQNHIATALSNAITQSRVGHAYLFTGARGVGKTSSARIFAKCLNCETGPTDKPCNECDICQAVSAGEDVDVLEIDGASNRGIDEIRQLRSNAAVRPSRCRYKIYIIDEVHMLTMQAFNALLKTLEEPPGHVKFIFCTTDPQKIPITVLSRCQRFDFSPVQTDQIAQSLAAIAKEEGVNADDQALALLARRANGSMRDSQSLLEQLFSFCGKDISVEEVHQLLGTADVGRIGEVAAAMANRDSTTTLNLINQSANEGINAGQLATQLLGYFRDVMAVRVGCGEDTLLTCTSSDLDSLTSMAEQLGLETILTIVQILDAAVVRMQSSLHARTLLEVAAIRVCNLENLESISDLVKQLNEGGASASGRRPAPRPAAAKKKVELKKVSSASKKNEIAEPTNAGSQPASASVQTQPARVSSPTSHDSRPQSNEPAATASQPVAGAATSIASESLSSKSAGGTSAENEANASEVKSQTGDQPTDSNDISSNNTNSNGISSAGIASSWAKMIEILGDMTSDMIADYEKLDVQGQNRVVVTLKDAYHTKECNKTDRKQKIETTLADVVGCPVKVDFQMSQIAAAKAAKAEPKLTRNQQIRKLQENEFVKETMSLFDAEITGYFEFAGKKKRAPAKQMA